MSDQPALSPAMLLFEVAAMCSRHGLAVSTDHPTAALDAAARLLRALGLAPHEPVAIAPAPPRTQPDAPTASLPVVPAFGHRVGRGVHRMVRPFSVVPDGNA